MRGGVSIDTSRVDWMALGEAQNEKHKNKGKNSGQVPHCIF